MKKVILLISSFLFICNLNATIRTVTMNTDDKDNPVEGMLRYYVKNAGSNDTIMFAVDSIGLAAEIRISYKSLTIDGGNGVILDGGQNGRVFNISFGSSENIVIKNLIVQNGLVNDASYAWGGGMYAFGSEDGLVVENCTFKNNTANTSGDGQGGAVRAQAGVFQNCFFLNNSITGAGSSNSGGGVMSVGSKFINCVFAGNYARHGGGAYATSGSLFLNCTVTQNSAESVGNGAGIVSEGGSTFDNCIIYNNISATVEDNLLIYDGTISYSALEAGNSLVGTSHNIGLTETPFKHSGPDSLSLKDGGVCIDAGYSNFSLILPVDIAGNERISGSGIDLGAYEFYVPIIITGVVQKEEGNILSNYNIHEFITVKADGSFEISEGVDNIHKGDTLVLDPAPGGYEFYPKKLVVDESGTVNIIAYKGIVVDETYPPKSNINWEADTINVFVDVNLDSSILTIREGSKIKFHNWNAIRVTGTGHIMAHGAYNKPILFTPADTAGYNFESDYDVTGAWHGIRFTEMTNADSSVFEYCTFQYGKGSAKESYGEPEYGGAISIYSFDNRYDKLKLVNCNISNNSSYGGNAKGGGISIMGGSALLVNCILSNNRIGGSNNYGGAIFLSVGNVTLVNCIIDNCGIIASYAPSDLGGGIYAYTQDCKVRMYNSVARNNYVNENLSQFSHEGNSYFEIHNCNIQGGNNFYAAIYENSFDSDPQFSDPINQDYTLTSSSPCINMGTEADISGLIPTFDIEGNVRINQGYIDIGPIEYEGDITAELSGFVKYEDGSPVADYSVYPGITTDATGYYSFAVGENGIAEGDTLILQAPEKYGFYPGRISIGVNKPKKVDIVAYKGKIVDEYSSFNDTVRWNRDTINVFSDININKFPLIVEPGAKVRFHKYVSINITNKGSIIANGTKNDSIIFRSAYPEIFNLETLSTQASWGGFRFNLMNAAADSSWFSYCRIEHAKNVLKGGAFYIDYFDKVNICNSEISYNNSENGGGVYLNNSDISLINCNIHHNTYPIVSGWSGPAGGGGIFTNYSNISIIGCNIHNNKALNSGGGLYLNKSTVNIINSNIVYNSLRSAGSEDGGIQAVVSGLTMFNSIAWGNQNKQISLTTDYTGDPSTGYLYNCNVQQGSSLSLDIYQNCIETDPLFIDQENGDYRLQGGSECISSGISADSVMQYLPQYDIAGNIRVMGDTIDIGACEYEETTLYISANNKASAGANIQFEGQVFMGTANSWSWDFNGDGIEDSNMQNPGYIFTNSGKYTVRLIAWINELSRNDTAFHTITVFSKPVADFSADTLYGSSPFAVKFIDKSTNSPTAWLWDFGDGTTSAEQDPEHIYYDEGSYTVRLIVKNIAGSDTLTKSDLITVYIPPKGFFSADIKTGNAPLTVRFTDYSLNNPTSWFWSFGDGGSSTEQNPSHTYQYVGTYSVELTVTNPAGPGDYSIQNYISVVENSSINDHEKNRILIFPNPVSSYLNISSSDYSNIRLMDITGKILTEKNFENSIGIDMSQYPRGIYFLCLSNENKTIIRKIMKE